MRLGLFSDAHGNAGALLKAYEALRSAGAEEIWFLGDLVGYVPDATIVETARRLPVRCLSGNHERMMLSADGPGPREHAYLHHATRQALGPSDLEFLRRLAPEARLTIDGRRLLLVHGSAADPVFGYVYPDTDLSTLAAVDADVVFMGHTHIPMDRSAGGVRFVNAGSCGLPRDGSGYGSACLYDTATDRLDFLKLHIEPECRRLIGCYQLSEEILKHFRPVLATTSTKSSE